MQYIDVNAHVHRFSIMIILRKLNSVPNKIGHWVDPFLFIIFFPCYRKPFSLKLLSSLFPSNKIPKSILYIYAAFQVHYKIVILACFFFFMFYGKVGKVKKKCIRSMETKDEGLESSQQLASSICRRICYNGCRVTDLVLLVATESIAECVSELKETLILWIEHLILGNPMPVTQVYYLRQKLSLSFTFVSFAMPT